MSIKPYTIFKNSILKDARKNYIHLIQYVLKKGNKNKIENMFRILLFFLSKKYVLQNKFEFKFILNAFTNTMPLVNLKTQRRGSRNIFIPIPVKKTRGQYLSAHWLITHASLKQDFKFFKNLAEELFESGLNKSVSSKKCTDIHKEVANMLKDIKIKKKKKKKKKTIFFNL